MASQAQDMRGLLRCKGMIQIGNLQRALRAQAEGTSGVVARLDPVAPRKEFHGQEGRQPAIGNRIGGFQVRTEVVPRGAVGGVPGILIALAEADREGPLPERGRQAGEGLVDLDITGFAHEIVHQLPFQPRSKAVANDGPQEPALGGGEVVAVAVLGAETQVGPAAAQRLGGLDEMPGAEVVGPAR